MISLLRSFNCESISICRWYSYTQRSFFATKSLTVPPSTYLSTKELTPTQIKTINEAKEAFRKGVESFEEARKADPEKFSSNVSFETYIDVDIVDIVGKVIS
jgi:hypothetical protein